MAWSSRSPKLYTAVPEFEKLTKLEERADTVDMVKERVRLMLVCHKKPSGFGVCEFWEECWGNTVRPKRSITTCTINCTWRPRVMCSRTSGSLWSTFIRRRRRKHEQNFSGRCQFVTFSIVFYHNPYILMVNTCKLSGDYVFLWPCKILEYWRNWSEMSASVGMQTQIILICTCSFGATVSRR